MAQNFTPDALFGTTVTGRDGDKIGKVDEVYLDNASGQPEWVAVKTGLFGNNVSIIPLAQASMSGDAVTVPFDKAMVKDAPHHDPGAELSESDETDLYRYYGITDTSASAQTSTTTGRTGTMDTGTMNTTMSDTTTSDTTTSDTDMVDRDMVDRDHDRDSERAEYTGTTAGRGAGHDTSGPNTDDAMTRSKEELHVGTETREAGRARLRKYITTETVSREVPVTREEVVVEREPITEANRGEALSGGELTEEEHEVVLTEERAVVATETVPVERVRVGTETVQDTETVQAEVREEHIDLDAGTEVTTGTRGTRGDRDRDHD